MCDNLKGLLSKVWKDEPLELLAGKHHFDEVVTVKVSGTVEKQNDQLVAPTTSIPLLLTIALLFQKSGATRENNLRMLREAIIEAMEDGTDKDENIRSYIKDCEAAVQCVKEQLISQLPKVKRSGRVVTKDLCVEVLPAHQELLEPVAA
jgi:hypothetical protein